jgi:alpha-D-xyloside xylohydrolase
VPWLFDEEAVDVLRSFTKLKCRLMPYLFGAAVQAHEHGTPVLRAMTLEFPADPGCDTLDRQYMLGDALLVAPVFSPDGMVDYYLPAGRWTHFLSGMTVEGGRWVREQHNYLSLPLMARPNSIIAVGANDLRPDYDFADGVTLHVFEPADGATMACQVPGMAGGAALTAQATRTGNELRITVQGAMKPWRVLLRGVGAVGYVQAGTASADALGTLITPGTSASTVIVGM